MTLAHQPPIIANMDDIKTQRGPVKIPPEVSIACAFVCGGYGVPVEKMQSIIDLVYKWGVVDGMTRIQEALDGVTSRLNSADKNAGT